MRSRTIQARGPVFRAMALGMSLAWAGMARGGEGAAASGGGERVPEPSLAEAVFITKAERAALERRFADGNLTARDRALMAHWRRLAPEAAAWGARNWEAGDNLYRGAWLVEAADYTPERGWASVGAAGATGGLLAKALEKAWTQHPRPGLLDRDDSGLPFAAHLRVAAGLPGTRGAAQGESLARARFLAWISAPANGAPAATGSMAEAWRRDAKHRLNAHSFAGTDGRRGRVADDARRLSAAHRALGRVDAERQAAVASNFMAARRGNDGLARHAFATGERRPPDWAAGWRPDADALLFLAGESRWSKEDVKPSAALWAHLSGDFHRTAETWGRVARAAEEAGDADTATAWWKRLWERFPATPRGDEAARRLDESVPLDPPPPERLDVF